MSTPRYLLITNPEGKRHTAFNLVLGEYWAARGINPQIQVIPWQMLVQASGDLSQFSPSDEPTYVRIESPGRDAAVTFSLLAMTEPSSLRMFNPTELKWSRRYFDSFSCILRKLDEQRSRFPAWQWSCAPLDIIDLFKKPTTAERLSAAGVPQPQYFPLPEHAEEVMPLLRHQEEAFLKLLTGSSAMGIISLRPHSRCGISTMQQINHRYFNTRSLQTLRDEELVDAIRYLMSEGAGLQAGIPSAQMEGLKFDARVIVIRNRPAFTIFRLSPHPMTNLHLGGRRGEWASCRAVIPNRVWLDAMDSCIDASKCFDADVVGIDLIFERRTWQHYVIEVNAFGDFFPGWRNEQGQLVHEVEVAASAERMGW